MDERGRVYVMRTARGLAISTVAFAAILAGVLQQSGEAGSSATGATSRVAVKMSDFKFALSKRTVPTGTVIFSVVNTGHSSHDFKIAGKKTRVLIHGQSQTLRVAIPRKGSYAFVCTLPGHVDAGMKGRLPVTAPAP